MSAERLAPRDVLGPVARRGTAGTPLTAVLVLGLAGLVGCSSGSGGTTAPGDPSPTTAATSPTDRPTTGGGRSTHKPSTGPHLATKVERRCGTAVPRGVRLTGATVKSANGVKLQTATLGSGPHGVVLIPQTDAVALCGWLPYAGHLATRGYHVALLDLRCSGASGCVEGKAATNVIADVRATAAMLRRRGADTVDLVGASYGGAIAIGACAPVRAEACVALSPALLDSGLGGGVTAARAITTLRTPLLMAVAPYDPDSSLGGDRALARNAPGGVVDFVTLPTGAGTAGTPSRAGAGARGGRHSRTD